MYCAVLLLFILSLLLLPLFVGGGLCWSLFSNALLSTLSSFVIVSLRKRELAALFKLCFCCHVAVSVLCFFTMVLWVGLWSVIVAFPGRTQFLFDKSVENEQTWKRAI